MNAQHDAVFLLDVDTTLLDNDHVQEDLRSHLERDFGADNRDRYWELFEELRAELGYADYLGALQRYRSVEADRGMSDPRLLLMSSFLVDYPFGDRLYPGALDPGNLSAYPAADLTVERIGDLLHYSYSASAKFARTAMD